MNKDNGKPAGDPLIRHFTHFTHDGAEDQWIAFTLKDDGRIEKSLSVSADAGTLLSYGLRQVSRRVYNDAKQ